MKLLALDTATEACSVALWLDGAVIERMEIAGREHSSRVPLMVDSVLAEAGVALRQLDGLVCGVGPGSFAGVRIGVSFVKGMALGLELPVAPVSSLAMLAQAAISLGASRVVAAIDARMAEVYLGRYDAVGGRACLDGIERVCPPDAAGPVESADFVATGTGWGAYSEALGSAVGIARQVDATALPRARDALALVGKDFAARSMDAALLVPAYLRNRVALTKLEQAEARAAAQKQ